MLCAATGSGSGSLTAAALLGAQSGLVTAIELGGALCLWSGISALLERGGAMNLLARLLAPILGRLFPSSKSDPKLRASLSGNICANLLGLGNAATPMGVQAARCLAAKGKTGVASNELCRLIILNTASIQIIPGSAAALRASLGSQSPFDILPAVWLTSLAAAAMGLGAAWLFEKLWPHE